MVTAATDTASMIMPQEEVIRETELQLENGVAYVKAIKITYSLPEEVEKARFMGNIEFIVENLRETFEKMQGEISASTPLMRAVTKGMESVVNSLDTVLSEAERANASDVQKVTRVFNQIFEAGDEDFDDVMDAFSDQEQNLHYVQYYGTPGHSFEYTGMSIETDPEYVDSSTVDYKVVYGMRY